MKKLKIILTISFNSFKEYLNSKFFPFFIAFSFILIYFSLVLGAMAVDYEKTILIDFGFAIMEISVMIFSVFFASMTIAKEIENKTIYLILSRQISKPLYITGKLLGIYMISFFIYLILFLIQYSLLFLKGYHLDKIYFISIFFSYLKIVIISTFSLFITSFTTSFFSSTLISLMFWIIGHFSNEINYLAQKSSGVKNIILNFFNYLIFNFQTLNINSYISFKDSNIIKIFTYFFSYFIILYILNIFAFRKKEF